MFESFYFDRFGFSCEHEARSGEEGRKKIWVVRKMSFLAREKLLFGTVLHEG